VVVGAGAAVSGMADGGLATEGELTSSAQEVPEAGWKEDAPAFIPGLVFVVFESGFEMRSASEPLAAVFGAAMIDVWYAGCGSSKECIGWSSCTARRGRVSLDELVENEGMSEVNECCA
jgi:hypothetical protein